MSDLDDIKQILEKVDLSKEDKKEDKETTIASQSPVIEETENTDLENTVIDMTGNSFQEIIDPVQETIKPDKEIIEPIKEISEPVKTDVVEEVQTPVKRGRKPKAKIGDVSVDATDVTAVEIINIPMENKPKDSLIDGYYVGGVKFGIQKLYPDVILPEYKNNGDACMDLRAYRIISIKNDMGIEMPVPSNFESIVIHKDWIVKIGLGFKCELQRGFGAEVSIRSGVSSEEGIMLLNAPGQIDCPYTGEWCIAVGKLNKKPFVLKKNMRIAQLKPFAQIKVEWNVVDNVVVAEDNERGEGGFGHTGLE